MTTITVERITLHVNRCNYDMYDLVNYVRRELFPLSGVREGLFLDRISARGNEIDLDHQFHDTTRNVVLLGSRFSTIEH
jgi:hypothetical protein